VETTDFSNLLQQVGAGLGIRRMEERFTRASDGVISYEFTLDDPIKWTQPYTVALSMRKIEGLVYEVACNEGNYALGNILRGARAVDGTPEAPVKEPGALCFDCEPPR